MAQRRVTAAGGPLVEGALEAPIIYFDGAPMAGVGHGAGRIVLEAVVQDVDEAGKPTIRRRIVAHLRGTPSAFASLRSAIESMDAIAAPPANSSQVN